MNNKTKQAKMVLEKIGETLKNTISKISKAAFVDEKLVNELIKDLQKALLGSDVNVKLVFELTNNIKKKVLKDDIPAGITRKDYLINVVYEEMVKFLGDEQETINIDSKEGKKPIKIMLVGLFGNGKTTTAGKLAKYFKKKGKKIGMIQTDTWRPASFKQLQQLGKSIDVPVYGDLDLKDPVKIYKKYEKDLQKYDIVIIDTAGRDALSKELTEEIKKIDSAVNADEKLLVIGADVGQGAEKQAQFFHEHCGVTGVIVTKMDGTAKGGGALAACSVTGAKVKFIGIGEKIDDFESFNPKGFVGRLIGAGDLEALLEKTQGILSQEKAQDLGKKFLKGEFTLIDLYDQMQSMKKLGPLNKVMEMIPGMGGMKIPKEALETQEEKLEVWRYLMDSMTKEELENPEIISSSRIERIAKGSATSQKEVRELLKQYKKSKKMIKMLKPGKGGDKKMQQMMKKFGMNM